MCNSLLIFTLYLQKQNKWYPPNVLLAHNNITISLLAHNDITISYYVHENSLRLKSSVASKWTSKHLWGCHFYASPSSGDAYSDRQLTKILSFDLKYLYVDLFPYEDSETLSISPYPDKKNNYSFINVSLTEVIDTSMERSARELQHGNPKIWISF